MARTISSGQPNGDGRDDIVISYSHDVLLYPGQADAHVGSGLPTGIGVPGISDAGIGGAFLAVADMNADRRLRDVRLRVPARAEEVRVELTEDVMNALRRI